MKKAPFKIPNCTGRLFLCIDNENEYLDKNDDGFEVGLNYSEALVDPDENNEITNKDKDVILLKNKYGIPQYVDEKSFILIEKEINKIALTKIWLN